MNDIIQNNSGAALDKSKGLVGFKLIIYIVMYRGSDAGGQIVLIIRSQLGYHYDGRGGEEAAGVYTNDDETRTARGDRAAVHERLLKARASQSQFGRADHLHRV